MAGSLSALEQAVTWLLLWLLVQGLGWLAVGVVLLAYGYRPLCIKLAQRGYAAATVSYRLAPKHQFPAAILPGRRAELPAPVVAEARPCEADKHCA